jgi:CrcB protein
MHYFWVAIGGILGANARFLLSNWAAKRYGTRFPIGTFIINLSGSFALGVITTLIAERFNGNLTASLLIGSGFLGAYTTFSTFTFEALALIQQGEVRAAGRYLFGSMLLGILGALLGISLTLAVV